MRAAQAYTVPAAVAATRPLLIGLGGAAQVEAAGLERSVRAAIAELARVAAIRTGQLAGTFVTLLTYSPALGDGELPPHLRRQGLQAISLPLEMLSDVNATTVRQAAETSVPINLPYRLYADTSGGNTQVYLADTSSGPIGQAVQVVSAVFDEAAQVYRVDAAGAVPRTVAFSTLGASDIPTSIDPGLVIGTGTPEAEQLPALAVTRLSDLLVCFPPDSGLKPQYLMAADHPAGPGIAVGAGQSKALSWLPLSQPTDGNGIVADVADQLRWQMFESTQALEQSVWKLYAREYAGQAFDDLNLRRMQHGFAPYAPRREQVAGRKAYELSHRLAFADGGNLFDLDNLAILSPAQSPGPAPVAPPWSAPGSAVSQRFAQRRAQQLEALATRQAGLTFMGLAQDTSRLALLTGQGRVHLLQADTERLEAAIRSALADVQAPADEQDDLEIAVFASVSSQLLTHTGGFAIAMPLASLLGDLAPGSLAASLAAGVTDLPVRLGIVESGQESLAYLVKPSAASPMSVVRVRAVNSDGRGVYSASTENLPPRFLTWFPAEPPGREAMGPTDLPALPGEISVYVGAAATPVAIPLNELPALPAGDIDDYIYIFPADSGIAPLYVVFAKPPVRLLEVGLQGDLSSRSRGDGLDIDHIPSWGAVKYRLLKIDRVKVSDARLKQFYKELGGVAIPTEVHRGYSETYGGRNSKTKQFVDAGDLKVAVDNNFAAIKPGLIAVGLSEAEVEQAHSELHRLNRQLGLYK